MKINFAHIRERSTSGGWIDFAVFDAKSTTGHHDSLLADLTARARNSGLRIDQSALVFGSGGGVKFFGDKNLVSYLSRAGIPRWTHSIDV